MSKIGEYIHLRRDTYLKAEGHSPRGKVTLFSQYEQAKNKALDNFLNGVGGNDKAAKNLENALNKLFPTDSETLNAIDESKKFKYNILQDAADSLDRAPEVMKQILNNSIKSGVLTATDNSKNEQTIAESSGRRRAGLTEIRGILRSMLKRIDEESTERWGWHRNVIDILNGIRSIERAQAPQGADEDTKKQVAKINDCLNEAQNKIAKLLKLKRDLINYTPKHSITISQDARVRKMSMRISRKNGNRSEVYSITRGRLTEAIKAITAALQVEAIVTKDIGDGAEYMLGAIARACNLGNDRKTQKAMGDYVFGDARTSIYFNLDLFSSDLEFLKEAKSTSSTGKKKKLYTAIKEAVGGKTGTVGYKSTSTSQDKIDVIYESEDVKAILQKAKDQGAEIEVKGDEERMTLSVKNYTQGGTFGGVSGTSFLSLVQSIDPDFVNHWINLTIGHQNKYNSSSFDFVSQADGGVLTKTVNEAHLIMQRYLIKLGAAGGALKFSQEDKKAKFIDQAQYIVWNDRSGKTKDGVTWHVYPMQRILSGIGMMTDLNNYIKVNTENYKDYFQDQNIAKGWVTKAPETDETNIDRIIQQRINNVLKFMWEQKITTETPITKALAASNA